MHDDLSRLLDLVPCRGEANDTLPILLGICFCIDGVGSKAGELVNRTPCFVRVCADGAVAGGGLVGRGLELVGNRCHACLARCRDGDAFDEVGHCHFDVEFYEVGEGMELDVSGRRWISKGQESVSVNE